MFRFLSDVWKKADFSHYFLHVSMRDSSKVMPFRARMLIALCFVSMIFVPFIYFMTLPSLRNSLIYLSIGFAVLFLSGIAAFVIIRFLGRLNLGTNVLLMGISLGLVVFAYTEAMSVTGTYYWFSGIGLCALYLFGPKVGKYWCAFALLCQIALIQHFNEQTRVAPEGMLRSDFVNVFACDVIGATLAVWIVAALYEMQRRRYEQDLEAAQKQVIDHREKLMHAARLTELGQIASGVAHEINNPLAIVHGYAARLRVEMEKVQKLSDDQANIFHNIERGCQRIATISRSLLSYAHENAYEHNIDFRCSHLREEVLVLCNEKLRSRSIQLSIDDSFPDHTLRGPYVKLLQVIVNLLNNAIDAATDSQEKWVKITIDYQEGRLIISVLDSGKGVPEELRERIRSPFFTTKAVGQGTGLGLSIVDGIMRDVGGDFYLDGDAPYTKFVIKFPLDLVES